MYMYIYIYTYIHIHIHIHISTSPRSVLLFASFKNTKEMSALKNASMKTRRAQPQAGSSASERASDAAAGPCAEFIGPADCIAYNGSHVLFS